MRLGDIFGQKPRSGWGYLGGGVNFTPPGSGKTSDDAPEFCIRSICASQGLTNAYLVQRRKAF